MTELLSVTVTVKFATSAEDGVPVIAPVDEFKFSPAGSVPDVTAKL